MLFPEWFEAWLVIAQHCLAVLLVLCVLVSIYGGASLIAGHTFAPDLSSLPIAW